MFNLAAHKSSKYYLALVSFIESSFFPIPPDVDGNTNGNFKKK